MIIPLTIKGEEQELPCSEVLELYPPKRNRDICEDEDVIKNTCCPMCHAAERNTEYGWHNLKKILPIIITISLILSDPWYSWVIVDVLKAKKDK